MIKKRLKGFSLIEIIVVISISSIILSSLFYLFSNINILNKLTTAKTEKSIEFAYFYHLIRNDLSNSVPGIINNENSIYLKDQNNLVINRLILNNKNPKIKNLIKIKWHNENGKIFRTQYSFSNISERNRKLIVDVNEKVSFKMEKINEQRFSNAEDDITPSVISIEIGKNKIKTLTFKVGNS